MRKKIFILCLFSVLALFLIIWTTPQLKNNGTIKIYDRNNILIYESAGNVGSKIPVTFDVLPKNIINATIASEDDTFWSNPGVDFLAMIRSAYLDLTHQKIVSGASTITQQLARTTLISPHETTIGRYLRKVREIAIAFRITWQYSKKAIITDYLNTIYYGNHAYGIQAASHTYFNKDISQLSLAEISLLTGIISAPDARDPYIHFTNAKMKQKRILALMVKDTFITEDQANNAWQEHLSFAKPVNILKAPHFVDYILQQLTTMGIQRQKGLSVYTTLDYPVYQLSNRIASLWITRLKNEHDLSNAALVLLNNKTGEILDMLGGIDYNDIQHAGQVNMTTALRQPGSALKPVTYATAFLHGMTPATLIYDVPKVYKTKKGEGYTPNNYDGQYHGLVLAREALASSFNLPAVEILWRIGIPEFLRIAHLMGIQTLTDMGRYDLSLTLGGGEVTLLDITNVYATFGREGQYLPTYAINKIKTDDNHTLYEHIIEHRLAALGNKSRDIAYLISSILSDSKARIPSFGEKNPLVLSHPAAVKTGTTTDWHDNWTIGYTPDYTVGVWVGNNDNHPMQHITGIVGAAPIWNQFFDEFLQGKPIVNFTKPASIVSYEICAVTGSLADSLCSEKLIELFIKGTEPKTTYQFYKAVQIDSRNNLLADISCPARFIKTKIFLNYPPEVYSWAVENHQEILPTEQSPLCKGPTAALENTYISLVYPKEKAVFENSPQLVANQIMDLEVNVSDNISSVQWFLDGNEIIKTSQFPFTGHWPPSTGMHTVYAIGNTKSGTSIKSTETHFSVVNYKDKY